MLSAPSLYSARLCNVGTSTCKPWQILLLHPVTELNLTNTTPQDASSLAFSQGDVSGVAFSAFGDGNFIVAEYAYVDGLSSPTGLGLAATGLPNLGNTCFLNATLQMIYSSPEMQAAVKELAKSDQDGYANDFANKLLGVLKEMDNPLSEALPIKQMEQIHDLMQSYDIYLAANDAKSIATFGATVDDNQGVGAEWKFKAQQQSADEFLTKFRNIMQVGVEFTEFRVSPLDHSGKLTVQSEIKQGKPAVINLTFDKNYNSVQGLLSSRFVNADSSGGAITDNLQRILADPKKGIQEINFVFSGRLANAPGTTKKIKDTRQMSIPNDLKIKVPFAESGANNLTRANVLYDQEMTLRSAIVHEGTADGGHYVTYVFNEDGTVLKYSDSTVTQIDDKNKALDAIAQNATSLHFVSTGERPVPKGEIEFIAEKYEAGPATPNSRVTQVLRKNPQLKSPESSNLRTIIGVGVLGIGASALVLTPVLITEGLKGNLN